MSSKKATGPFASRRDGARGLGRPRQRCSERAEDRTTP